MEHTTQRRLARLFYTVDPSIMRLALYPQSGCDYFLRPFLPCTLPAFVPAGGGAFFVCRPPGKPPNDDPAAGEGRFHKKIILSSLRRAGQTV